MNSKLQEKTGKSGGAGWGKDFQLAYLALGDIFPDEDGYHDSRWHIWDEIISTTRQAEKKRIANMGKEYTDQTGSGDWMIDRNQQSEQLARMLHATLIGSLWSDLEQFLKSLIRPCSKALKKGESAPHEFKGIKKFFKKNLSVDLERLPDGSIVEAIRILNNTFKRSKGYYTPEHKKPWTHISPHLLTKWEISTGNEIDFSKIPIQELALACNRFCRQTLEEAQQAVKSKIKN